MTHGRFCRDRGRCGAEAGALCLSFSPYDLSGFGDTNESPPHKGQAQGPLPSSHPPLVPTGRSNVSGNSPIRLSKIIRNSPVRSANIIRQARPAPLTASFLITQRLPQALLVGLLRPGL